MITKGIVEELISPYQVRVRIPLLDGIPSDPNSTKTKDLGIATICSLPNCYLNVNLGDIVFISFEDNTRDKLLVLGVLSAENQNKTYSELTLSRLDVVNEVKLPAQTTIGNVTPEDIQKLTNLYDNVQKQLNSLKERLDIIDEKLNAFIATS